MPSCVSLTRSQVLHWAAQVLVVVRKGKKGKDYAFLRQFHEEPSIIPGCPGGHRCYPSISTMLHYVTVRTSVSVNLKGVLRTKWRGKNVKAYAFQQS